MKNGIFNMLSERVKSFWNQDQQRPLIVSVMGQTGVGKTSLVNALFGSTFKVSSTRPETLEPQMVEQVIRGKKLQFWDLPGLGESHIADDKHFETYKAKLLESHIVIWAIHADSRALKADRDALKELIASAPSDEGSRIMNKIIFTFTKADLLSPSPWLLTKEGSNGVFSPRDETKRLLVEKEAYFQEAFVASFDTLLKAQTYHDGNFNIKDEYLDYDESTAYHKGWMSKGRLDRLLDMYPEHEDIFYRLYNNYRVIPCSTLFRFNLHSLMMAIVDKLEPHAAASFENFQPNRSLSRVPFKAAKHFVNIVVWDKVVQQLHDLGEMDFSNREILFYSLGIFAALIGTGAAFWHVSWVSALFFVFFSLAAFFVFSSVRKSM
jgi:GTP-binding protein EngB required for normal cell division